MSEYRATQYKKELLYRKANGKKILDAYLRKAASLFLSGDRPELISLEETDAILERFQIASSQLFQETVRTSANGLQPELSAIRSSGGSFYVLIDDDWKYCGMLVMKKMETLSVAVEFGEKILNDLVFISTDMSSAISFDFFEMDRDRLIDIKKWRNK